MPERIEIIVSADAADASDALEELADQIEELTGTRPEISVGTEGAVADIEAVGAAATDTAAATEAMGEGAVDSIGSIKGSTRDMLRPLGLAKSTVGDLNDTFQLMADTAVESMNLTEEQAGKLATALPFIGVAVGLAVSAWQTYSKAQEATAEAADKQADAFREVGDALAAGEIEDAAARLLDANKDIFDSAADLGVPYEELAQFIVGAADALPSLMEGTELVTGAEADLIEGAMAARDAFGVAADGAGLLGDKTASAEQALRDAADAQGGAAAAAIEFADAIARVNEELDAEESALDVAEAVDQLETAYQEAWVAALQFGAGSEEAQDANRNLQGQLIDGKRSVLEYAESIDNIPEETMTDIRAMLARGDIAGAEAALNNVARDRESTITVRPRVLPGDFSSWGGGLGGGAQGFAAPAGLAAGTHAAGAGMSVAPQVIVRIDARGAVDPYSVGRAVEQAAGAWGRVSGRWRPGLRSVS